MYCNKHQPILQTLPHEKYLHYQLQQSPAWEPLIFGRLNNMMQKFYPSEKEQQPSSELLT